jgi:hypothetical protein
MDAARTNGKPDEGETGRDGPAAGRAWPPSRAALAVGLLAASLYPLIAWRALERAPPGHVFVRNISSHEDISNYLGYAQQVGEGSLLFRNKLTSIEHEPALLNLEWAATGTLSWALGHRPFLAFRILGALATLLLAGLIDAWLLDSGLPHGRRLAALVFVFTGGGLGSLALMAGMRPYDLLAGFYPFLMVITNPHFVVGTALVLAALRQLVQGRVGRGVALCAVLALVRPYDCALVVAVDTAAVLMSVPWRQWPRRLAPWAALAPFLAYDAWLFLINPGYAVFSYGAATRAINFAPSLAEMVSALGPAALLAFGAAVRAPAGSVVARRYLALWAITAAAIVFWHPVSFALQFGVGIGVPLLGLGAVGLAHMRRGVLEGVTVLLSGSLLVLMRFFWLAPSSFYVPETTWRLATHELRTLCRPGQRLLAPQDVGLLAQASTSCSLYLPYSLSPEFVDAKSQFDGFYGAWSPAQRAELLERACVDHVVLPVAGGDVAPVPLAPDAPYAPSATVSGAGPSFQVASRTHGCEPAVPGRLSGRVR